MNPSASEAFNAYHAPTSLHEALSLLAQSGARPLAGGTDLVARMNSGALQQRGGTLVSLHLLDGLRAISVEGDDLVIGALVTVAELRAVPCLAEAADRFAGPQIRNAATLGGNLCNASPAADLAPPLLAVDASVLLAHADGLREVPLTAWFLGPGRTAIRPGELLVGVRVPRTCGRVAFEKAGTRPALDISLVSVAATARVEGGRIRGARVALGAVAPTPIRSPAAEAVLLGAPATLETVEAAARAAQGDARPISDVRASAAYRQHLTQILTRRALRRVLDL